MTAVVDAASRVEHRVVAVYPGFDQVLATIRSDVAAWCRGRGVSTQLAWRGELVVSELATNAIEASPGSHLELILEDHNHNYNHDRDHDHDPAGAGLSITVTNVTPGPSPPPRRAWRPAGPLAARGRGLAIVAAIADEVIVDRSRAGLVTVTALLHDLHTTRTRT